MKTLIISSVTAMLFLLSCTKEEQPQERDYSSLYGMYNSTSGDTVTVSAGSGSYLKVRFAYKSPFAFRGMFDSVRLNSDNTIVCNEYTTSNTNQCYTAVGAGAFGKDMLSFNIVLGAGGGITFNGVKK